MHYLWTPWRMAYISAERAGGCIFCEKPAEQADEQNLILLRGERVFSMLNLYPYNTGHLMIAPYRHIADFIELTREELLEMGELTQRHIGALRRALRPDGFNLGMNLGSIAGAGIADHLHLHVVPRWAGDTNFMPIVAGTKVMPELLETTYQKLRAALAALEDRRQQG
ncbi:MAG: HIT family hydrolase [Chloroflexota bacterium]